MTYCCNLYLYLLEQMGHRHFPNSFKMFGDDQSQNRSHQPGLPYHPMGNESTYFVTLLFSILKLQRKESKNGHSVLVSPFNTKCSTFLWGRLNCQKLGTTSYFELISFNNCIVIWTVIGFLLSM